ncbi:PREDICTED: uncharacterized protein LOC109191311 [Ipomoea nil]|uniref:uncharacterized protein LOC109191311 n=1 Tax=Ipomoea nil TaxID=35883 RepID=UPI00090145C1|nr:PREDICTED: uncharacterized protein LOC109191311 [Ipomoea nil]
METLVVVAQHRNQYYNKSKGHGPVRFGSFGSPPSGSFREINCRTFQTGSGILPTPLKSYSTPITKRSRSASASFSPKTPSPSVNSQSEDQKNKIRSVRSSAIPINLKVGASSRKGSSFSEGVHFSERWAGPTYSNSPPPSSLPMPKFSLKPKRTVSLELPTSASAIDDFCPIAASAPASPTRERSPSPGDLFDLDDSATKCLRRILNLDITDD